MDGAWGDKKKKKRLKPLKSHMVCFKASRSMSYPLFQTALLGEKDWDDVTVVSQCGAGVGLVRFSGDPVGFSLSCWGCQPAAGHQLCS